MGKSKSQNCLTGFSSHIEVQLKYEFYIIMHKKLYAQIYWYLC